MSGVTWSLEGVGRPGLGAVQFTPPHSGCSIQFGKGGTAAEPGSMDGLILVVEDIDAARDDLVGCGVDWQLQEITTRLPGREWED